MSGMQDRREQIIEAGIAVLRESGYAGFTQPRVAARLALRQSHLTYYFPTRADLLAAVARAAVDAQLAAVDTAMRAPVDSVTAAIATLTTRHENTRVLMALAQAADQEPQLRALFRELADGVVVRAGSFLKRVNPDASETDARLLHALSVGLAVIELATGRADSKRRAVDVLDMTMTTIAKGRPRKRRGARQAVQKEKAS